MVSDLFGASGRRILTALSEGEHDPARLAALGSARLKASPVDLQDALDGCLSPTCQFLLGLQLRRYAELEQDQERIQRALADLQRAHQDALTRLCEIPGLALDSVQQILAEIGPQAAAFPSAGQLASWVGVCPGREESAGVSKNDRSPKGNRVLRRLLPQAAWAAVKADGSVFQILFRRWTPRMGQQKAICAIAHRLLRAVWLVLHKGVRYIEFGANTNPQAKARRQRTLVAALRKLGFAVTLSPLHPQA